VALVPASLLPHKTEWQRVANVLPKGSVLIVLPFVDRPKRSILERVTTHLRAHGHGVATLPAERFV
jgi:hypothetical protein